MPARDRKEPGDEHGSGDLVAAIRRRYLRFAEDEAHGVSPLYEALATALGADEAALARIADLPQELQQPNLVLAAVRWLHGTAADAGEFLRWLHGDWDRVATVVRAHRTQTNEPGRCATLLPVLASLPQPLALVEIGASAGLCLLPDRYRYRYGDVELGPTDAAPTAPRFDCRVSGPVPVPTRLPEVAWRAGLDLAPVDLRDPAAVAWLEALIWPEQHDRLERFRAAVDIARAGPPRVVAGDLRHDLEPLLDEAPAGATVVVFHSAVLAYLRSRRDIDVFAAWARDQHFVWVSNEAATVLPGLATGLDRATAGRFVLSVDGTPLALTGPHGQSIEWLGAGTVAGAVGR